DQGIGPGAVVGVCMERSLELMIVLLGVLKAGAAYLPLDPAYPEQRLTFMMADAAVPIVLTQRHLRGRLPGHQAIVVCVDTFPFTAVMREPLDSGVSEDNLAYVLYTSRSTGTPKGVMIPHRGIRNRLQWMQEAYQLTSQDRVAQKTPLSFDVSVWELFWPLMYGGQLVLMQPEEHRDPAALVHFIQSEGITIVHFVPSMLGALLDQPDLRGCTLLRYVICSGEALPSEYVSRFYEHLQAELHNLYGPTEVSVDVSAWPCSADQGRHVVPIGRPIANHQLYVLDAHLEPVPIGVAGGLYIGGVGLGAGFLYTPPPTRE